MQRVTNNTFILIVSSLELILHHAEDEYLNGNTTRSIFYQVLSVYQSSQEHYYKESTMTRKSVNIDDLMSEMSAKEASEFKE